MLELVDEYIKLKELHAKILKSLNAKYGVKGREVTSLRKKIQPLVIRNLTEDDIVDIVESLNSDLDFEYLTMLVRYENRCIQDEAHLLGKIGLPKSQFLKLVELTKFLREKDSQLLNDCVVNLVNDLKGEEMKRIEKMKEKVSNFKDNSQEDTLEQAKEILRFSKKHKISIDKFKDVCYNKLYKILIILGDNDVQSESDSDTRTNT